jgi:hypothetical protein
MRPVRVVFILILTLIITYATAPVMAENNKDFGVGLKRDLIYFVMPDRYLNGDLSNDNLSG